MKLNYAFFIAFLLISSCQVKEIEVKEMAQIIIDKAIEKHGGSTFDSLDLEFDFRKFHYIIKHDSGNYNYTRTYKDSLFLIKEVLDNNSVRQWKDDTETTLSEKNSGRITRSINSQVYFTLLPYHLNDNAVIKDYLGEKIVKGKPYHKIKVTFQEEGGGEDFDDEFIYWFHKEDFTMDYLAYEFHVNDGGFRFREAYNIRNIEGIMFSDFINYAVSDTLVLLADYDVMLENGSLKELSRIELENITSIE